MLSRVVSIASGLTLMLLDLHTASGLTTRAVDAALHSSGGNAKQAALTVAGQWSQSVVRRGVVFGGCLRVPLSLLLADVLVLFAVTPEPPPNQDLTEAILNASDKPSTTSTTTSPTTTALPLPSPSTTTTPVSKGLSVGAQLGRFVLATVWGVGGSLLFHRWALNWLIPHALPHVHSLVGTLDVMMSPIDEQDQASLAAGAGVDKAAAAAAAAAATGDGSAGGGGQASAVVYALSAVDRDTCSFLFLVFSAQATAIACLASSRAAWRCRLSLPSCVILPPCAAASLFLACNGMVGGVYAGADPAAALATLLFALAYHLVAAFVVQKLVPPYP